MKWWSNRIKNTFSLIGFSESRLRRLPENQARERYQQGEEKDSDNENDRENGLRMKNEMTMKEKRFSFFCRPAEKESGKPTHIWHIAFCPTHEPTLRKSQRAKSC
jgi:hypothetical protein